jgi:hypothetical protein
LFAKKASVLYPSPDIRVIKSRRWAGHVAHMWETRNVYKTVFGNKPLGGSTCRWEDIKMDLKEIGWEGVDWIYLAEDKVQ